jgi:excisionase family DNA binding protein
MSTQPLISVPGLAEVLGVSKWTVYRLYRQENWPTSPVGGSVRFSPDDVEKIIAWRRTSPEAATETVTETKPGLTPKQKSAAIKRLGLRSAA